MKHPIRKNIRNASVFHTRDTNGGKIPEIAGIVALQKLKKLLN